MTSKDIPSTSGNLSPKGATSVVEINLDELNGKIHQGVDLVGYRLMGRVRPIHDLGAHNFISCVFDNVFANEIDLTRCDFKDVLVRNTHFRRCAIQASTHSTTFYIDSKFEECDFTNGAHTACEYRKVTFVNCQLSNLLAKNSRFTDCAFDHCKTKTHVFEGNLFLRTRFSDTDLETRTIVSNFGLKRSLADDCRIRSGRISEPYSYLDEQDFHQLATSPNTTPLSLLSILYFLSGNLLCGGQEVDRAFDAANWLVLAHQPASFAQLIELLAEFLVNAFDSNEVEIHKILLLHDATRQIIATSSDDVVGSRIRLAFGGIHLALSRIVESYLFLLSNFAARQSDRTRVLVNGPPVQEYFEDLLAEVLDHCGVRISSARPHNSPTEVEFIEFLPGGRFFLLALILATFVRVELLAHSVAPPKQLAARKIRNKTRAGKSLAKETDFFELSAGMSAEQRRAYELRIKALMPLTSIVVELKLAVSTQLIQKLRQVIIRILE